MADLLTLDSLFTLLMLVLLQAVLGFDNLLYISLESKKAPESKQSFVRKMGIGVAIVLRIGLLFILTSLIRFFQDPIFGINLGEMEKAVDSHGEAIMLHGLIDSSFNIHSLIVLIGGGFIIYTAIKEIWHMISHESLSDTKDSKGRKSVTQVITMIVVMNLVFSFDSILSAMALTSHIPNENTQLILMTLAIIVSGILMIVLADKVSSFLQKNRMYEVLGLFVLLIVGIMLLTEGGHLAHIQIFGNPIEPMSKTTFYFVIIILVIVDIIQGKYQKQIIRAEQKEEENDQQKSN